MSKLTKTNIVADIETAGFDLKLTKDDLFELALEEMINRKTSELNDVKVTLQGIVDQISSIQESRNKVVEKHLKAMPLVKEFYKFFPKASNGNISFNAKENSTLRCNSTLSSNDSDYHYDNSSLQLKFEVPDLYGTEVIELTKQRHEVSNKASMIQVDIAQLEKSPRKAKVAMLKTMLQGTEAGTNLLASIKGISIGIDVKTLAPVKK